MAQMAFAEHHDMIEAFPADRADHSPRDLSIAAGHRLRGVVREIFGVLAHARKERRLDLVHAWQPKKV